MDHAGGNIARSALLVRKEVGWATRMLLLESGQPKRQQRQASEVVTSWTVVQQRFELTASNWRAILFPGFQSEGSFSVKRPSLAMYSMASTVELLVPSLGGSAQSVNILRLSNI